MELENLMGKGDNGGGDWKGNTQPSFRTLITRCPVTKYSQLFEAFRKDTTTCTGEVAVTLNSEISGKSRIEHRSGPRSPTGRLSIQKTLGEVLK